MWFYGKLYFRPIYGSVVRCTYLWFSAEPYGCADGTFGDGRTSHIWGHTPEQRVAASTMRRYFFGFRLTIAQTVAYPVMLVSFR